VEHQTQHAEATIAQEVPARSSILLLAPLALQTQHAEVITVHQVLVCRPTPLMVHHALAAHVLRAPVCPVPAALALLDSALAQFVLDKLQVLVLLPSRLVLTPRRAHHGMGTLCHSLALFILILCLAITPFQLAIL
jgi:hypothetical protein